ncbi:DUF262 domain-containing protein [Aliiroseovarius crassostreae]|uniref:DUF262 domain-containing protein n=1 Tax=Aliiroseovarius crassostreae TaxID=154981 RepID=UPI0021FBF5BC|nr:DUF262 domain-containing protein [Aliiroseovarius crassostreae]UWP91552.1 DUF262 domain-containing protein [Aliiroseovarius crassostreae]
MMLTTSGLRPEKSSIPSKALLKKVNLMIDNETNQDADIEQIAPEEVDVEILDGEESEEVEVLESAKRFNVSSYGWEPDVEGLVKRLKRGDIFKPGFQRGFVWGPTDKSRFVESLILGLPVPTLFLAKDSGGENKLNIIDGQQRLETLKSYFAGEFALSGKDISPDLKGRYHSIRREKSKKAKILEPSDERTLSDAIIHSIVIRPNPKDDDEEMGSEYNRALIQIFQRLNTTGKALNAQEIRSSIFHGPLLRLLHDLNQNPDWRALFGAKHGRMKDEEAILRALALYSNGDSYKSPMPGFLDNYMEDDRYLSEEAAKALKLRFELAVKLIRSSIGDDALKRGGTFVLTRFDALVVGLMAALRHEAVEETPEFEASFQQKLGDRNVAARLQELEQDNRGIDEDGEEIEGLSSDERGYNWSIAKFTNDTNRVEVRLRTAIAAFAI